MDNNLTLLNPENDLQLLLFFEQAVRLKEVAEARVIMSNDDLKPATDDLSIIAKVKKGMEERRKDYLKPFQDHVKETNEAYKRLMEPIEKAWALTKQQMLEFEAEQERKHREAEAIEAEKMALAQREAELNNGEITVDLTPVEKPEAVPDRIRTDMGTAGQRSNWKWKVIAFSEIPDAFKVIDSSLLTSIAKKHHDTKPIPGVEFYNEPIIAVNIRYLPTG